MPEGYVAGLDGGGTKTAVECLAPDGSLLLEGTAGPLNINGNSPEAVAASLQEALALLAGLPGGLGACRALCIGAAGVSNPALGALLARLVRKAGYGGPLRLAGDHETALAGALNGRPGMILIAGTGSICYGRDGRGREHRCGGWGHVISDEGSGYALGRAILSAVAWAGDGRAPQTLLTALVYEQLGIDSLQKLVAWLYHPATGKREVAALAPLLGKARAQGDAAAMEISDRAATELAGMALATAGALGLAGGEAAFGGSVLEKDRALAAEVARRLADSGLRHSPAEAGAAHGAALLALEQIGG